jgi:membrane peptidoglycan carboxypeptidase
MYVYTGPKTFPWINYTDMSPHLFTALKATEDPAFMHHNGIIPKAFEVCLRERLSGGRICGGSTITMQLAKNLFLNRNQTFGRKLQEMFFAFVLESSLTKEQILELYLNVVEFGPDTYGIFQASDRLFGKLPHELTLRESICLTSRLPSPIKAAPCEQKKRFIDQIITNLVKGGEIDNNLALQELQSIGE